MRRNLPNHREDLRRYLTGRGRYPYDIEIQTPTRMVRPRLYSHHDILTVNEIFCRLDYPAGPTDSVIVDIGSNIGLSALFFLTRSNHSRCYLFEPDPRNVVRLKQNLADFKGRYTLTEKAVGDRSGTVEFGIERSGRYGGIGIQTGESIEVECLNINTVLTDIIEKEGSIDILKIDTEGMEEPTVKAIKPVVLINVDKIYLDAYPRYRLHPQMFRQRQYGSVNQLINMASHGDFADMPGS
jgi:FkbM family methyltransferase